MNVHMPAGAPRRLATALARAALAATAALAIGVLGTAAQAAPPAGTTIGNQATATYTDAAANSFTVTSNLVTTVVQQVASVTLVANNARTAAPGAQAVFPHVLTNTGNGTDTFSLVAANQAGDNFDLSGLAIYADADGNGVPDNFVPLASTGPLAPGGTFRFVVVGSVPGTQLAGDAAIVQVTATSGFDGTQSTFNTDLVTVTTNAVLNVTKSISAPNGASPSGPYTYTLTYTNSGNATATGVRLTDLVPAGMTYVAGSARWSGTGAAALTDADSTDAQGGGGNTVTFDDAVATPGALTWRLAQVASGQSGTVTFQVQVAAGLTPQIINNSARFAYNDGAADVGPFFTNLSPFTVNQAVSLTFTGQVLPSVLQGGTATFTNTLVNTGNGTDVFDISVGAGTFPAGSTVQLFQSDGVTPLTDSNGNTIPDVGPLAPGASYAVVLKVTLPPSATGGPYQVSKTATSASNPAVNATATDVLTSIVANTVDLTNNNPLPGGAGAGAGPEAAFQDRQAGNPGTTVRFTLYVNNTSAQADAFDLAASTDPTFAAVSLPAGWSVTFLNAALSPITGTGSIAAGGNLLVYADVAIPAGYPAGNVELYFRGRSPLTTAKDVIHDEAGVNTLRQITLVPNNTAQVIPGGFVVFSHTLSNTGNVTEGDGTGSTVTLTSADTQAGWSSALYWDTNNSGAFDAGDQPLSTLNAMGGLAPGGSVRVFAQVFSPAGAPVGQTNTTTVTATTVNGTYVTAAPPAVSATDLVTVINGQLTIDKFQALDANCDGVEDAAFTKLNLTAGAIPGACLRYEIVVTNTGTSPVTNVTINDATPANTWSWDAASATTSQGTIVVPADGTGGPITANIGALAPGASATIRFDVRIVFP